MELSSKPILDRDDDNKSRRLRLKQMKRGPGVFVYDGSHEVVEHTPTILLTRKQTAQFGPDGMPLMDASGRQLFKPLGTPVLDPDGRPQMGGPPREERIAQETRVIRGVEFEAGVAKRVTDPALALKLRCIGGFDELDGDELAEFVADEGGKPAAAPRLALPAAVKPKAAKKASGGAKKTAPAVSTVEGEGGEAA